ncbi:hypothetical protein Mal65_52770 [Crateriforma conspicua]|nr:hypothetical protein Mal65_52770 [Crateriforma conspicua]
MADSLPFGGSNDSRRAACDASGFARHFGLTLSSDLIDWIDQALWRHTGCGEFHEAVDPASLMDDPADTIWPGLMPPDFLPLIGNGRGDWICGRVSAAGTVDRFVHWYHGGGDWIPWGNRLGEAVLFDVWCPLLPGPGRRHAIEPDDPRAGACLSGDHPWIQWAADAAHPGARELMQFALAQTSLSGDEKATASLGLADGMIRHGIAEVAVRCEMIQNHRDDWPLIGKHASAAAQTDPDLAWAWEWLAMSHDSLGQPASAANCFAKAACCSAFTDQAVRMRPPGVELGDAENQAAKLSVAWLRQQHTRVDELAEISSIQQRYVSMLVQTDPSRWQQSAHDFWLEAAEASAKGGNGTEAVNCLIRSGWDLGIQPLSVYGDVLNRLAAMAGRFGDGRARLCQIHADCFRQRYQGLG